MNQNLALWLAASLLLAGCQPPTQGTSVVSPRSDAHSVTVALVLPFTGSEPDHASWIKNGVTMAIEEVNAAGGANGLTIKVVAFDSGNGGQFDAGRAAVRARAVADNPEFVAVIGPMMSGEGKAMSPILSEASLATVTPSSTNPDITNPRFTAMFRPSGKAIYFRTVTTDALQGPNMANWLRDRLKVKSVYVLDDGGAYGKGVADGFESQARKIGMTVLVHDRLDPNDADYSAVLTKIKSTGSEAIYYGGVSLAGAKLATQAHDMLPNVIKAGADGIQGASFLKRVGFPAAEGWYTTNACPHVLEEPAGVAWAEKYRRRFPGQAFDDYSVTAYDAGLVVADAIKRAAASGKPITRDAMRDAIQQTKLQTVQGEISFDFNGDVAPRVVSVFQYRENKARPIGDYAAHTPYVGAALEMPRS